MQTERTPVAEMLGPQQLAQRLANLQYAMLAILVGAVMSIDTIPLCLIASMGMYGMSAALWTYSLRRSESAFLSNCSLLRYIFTLDVLMS